VAYVTGGTFVRSDRAAQLGIPRYRLLRTGVLDRSTPILGDPSDKALKAN
jgi:hypothetical protein